MKITIAQLNYHIGNFEGNMSKILDAIKKAKENQSDIIVFGELATTGYPPRDFLEFHDFIERSNHIIEELCKHTKDLAIVIGAPHINPVVEGKDLFNSAYFLYNNKIQHIQHKTLLPTYDIFDEYRYFEPNSVFKAVHFKGYNIALTVCEDIWNVANENPLYTICPLDEFMDQDIDFVLNLSASPFSFEHANNRIEILRANVAKYNIPFFYVNHVGAQTEILFDGGSIVMSPNGQVFEELPYFEPCIRTYDVDEVIRSTLENQQPKDKYSLIHDALVMGIREYFSKLGLSKATLGLSGGIDSALVAVLAQRALGKENVRCVLMPSQFSSDHSVNDALELVKNLDVQHDIIHIEDIYNQYLTTLKPIFKDRPFDIAEENIQARSRGMLLMAISNKFGHIVLNTSNKSEAAVGYGTLYGDMVGGLSVIADIYKTEVFELAKFINQEQEIIPSNIITKPPSAELRPDQFDSDSLPDYAILDTILYEYIENQKGPKEIIDLGFDKKLVERILKLVNRNEFKRYQVAPVLRVSSKAFGMGRRMPIVAKYLL